MKLRPKLILAFLLLAVIPLASICLYSYWSSLKALKNAAERESQTLTEDMSSRLDSVSRDVNTRLERLASFPFMPPPPDQRNQQLDEAIEKQAEEFLSEMGEVAPYLESMQFTPAGTSPSAKGPVPSASQGALAAKPAPGLDSTAGEGAVKQNEFKRLSGIASEISRLVQERKKTSPQQDRWPQQKLLPGVGQRFEGEPPRQENEPLQGEQPRQGGQTPQVNFSGPNMLGRQFNTRIVEDGRFVGTFQARVSSQQILRNVLMRTERKQGEIPFAIDASGTLHTPDPADRAKLEGLPLPYPDKREAAAEAAVNSAGCTIDYLKGNRM